MFVKPHFFAKKFGFVKEASFGPKTAISAMKLRLRDTTWV